MLDGKDPQTNIFAKNPENRTLEKDLEIQDICHDRLRLFRE